MEAALELISLLKTRFSYLNETCNNLEELLNGPAYPKQDLRFQLTNLKNELRLVEVAIPGHKLYPLLRNPILSDPRITPEELYILLFSNTKQFQNKAFKGNITSIIECISAIRASISLWQTRIFCLFDKDATKPSVFIEPLSNTSDINEFEWDVFISHATEDKETFVCELAHRLEQYNLRVWYDDFTLKVGDSLRESIEKGLSNSRYGIVILSHAFFKKDWPQRELSALLARDSRNQKVILPIWLDLDATDIAKYFPLLADIVACKAKDGMDRIISDLMSVLKP